MKDRKLPCYSNATDYDKYIFWMGLTAEAFVSNVVTKRQKRKHISMDIMFSVHQLAMLDASDSRRNQNDNETD